MTMAPRVSLIGGSGQLACALMQRSGGADATIVAAGRPRLDICRAEDVADFIDATKPDVVINTAAYTAVDKAESEREAAYAINAQGTLNVARACAAHGVPLIHLSTDYVFDGCATKPYGEDHPVAPAGVYGASKVEGERLLRDACERHLIVRTQWIYSLIGNNFLNTMLRLGAGRDEIRVVADQIGSPTYAIELADALLMLARRLANQAADEAAWGTYHLAGGGATSWYGLARAIFDIAATQGLRTPDLVAIDSSQYPTAARRPAYSVLDCSHIYRTFDIALRDWRTGLADCMSGVGGGEGTGVLQRGHEATGGREEQ